MKCFRWCDMKVLFSDTINEWYKHKANRIDVCNVPLVVRAPPP